MEGFLSGFMRLCIGVSLVIFSICFGLGGDNIVELVKLLSR